MDRLLEKDIVVRILSVLLAVAIWFQVSAEQNRGETQSVDAIPVQVVARDPSLLVTAPPQPWTVKVELQGSRRALERVGSEDINASVDLSDLAAGSSTVPVNVQVPAGVKLVRAFPDRMSITLEQAVSRDLPVDVQTTGTPPPDVLLGQPRLERLTARVHGPQSVVARVASLVVRIGVGQLTQHLEMTAPLVPVDSQGNEVKVPGLRVEPSSVTVHIPVDRLAPAKVLPVRVQFAGEPPWGFLLERVAVQPALVTVRGPAEAHASWQSVETDPIPLGGIEQPFELVINLRPPAGADSVEPSQVRVAVALVEEKTDMMIEGVPVQVRGLGEGRTVELVEPDVRVRLWGTVRGLTRVQPSNIAVSVDVSGLPAGLHRVALEVTAPDGAEGAEADVDAIEVTLSEKE